MPLFKTKTAAIYGVDALLIDVEVDVYMGSIKDYFTVGLPDAAVKDSRERIKSSLINAGFGYPNKAITVNLAPANITRACSRRAQNTGPLKTWPAGSNTFPKWRPNGWATSSRQPCRAKCCYSKNY